MCALGGVAGATFALPFRGIKEMRYESYWMVYAVVGLVLFPLALALATCPGFFKILGEADGSVIARCIGFGALWGLGGLTWGLMIRYLGIGLGLAIGCGLCSATGTLIPPIVTGHAGDLVKDTASIVTLASVVVSLVGIILVGFAGKLKEGELDEEAKKKAVAEFDFKKGMIVAVFSGIASAGMNFGLQGGAPLESAAVQAGVDSKWIGMPVLVIVLWGGFAVNVLWCLWQNACWASRRYLGDAVRMSENRRASDERHALHLICDRNGQLRPLLVAPGRRSWRVEGYGRQDEGRARARPCSPGGVNCNSRRGKESWSITYNYEESTDNRHHGTGRQLSY